MPFICGNYVIVMWFGIITWVFFYTWNVSHETDGTCFRYERSASKTLTSCPHFALLKLFESLLFWLILCRNLTVAWLLFWHWVVSCFWWLGCQQCGIEINRRNLTNYVDRLSPFDCTTKIHNSWIWGLIWIDTKLCWCSLMHRGR